MRLLFGVQLGIHVGGRVGDGAAEAPELLVGDVRVKVDQFVFPAFIGSKGDGLPGGLPGTVPVDGGLQLDIHRFSLSARVRYSRGVMPLHFLNTL